MRTSDAQFRKALDRKVGSLQGAADAQEAASGYIRPASRPVAYPAKHRKTWQATTLTERIRSLTHRGGRRGA